MAASTAVPRRLAAVLSCAFLGCSPPQDIPPLSIPQDIAAAWSPDGTKLAFQHEGEDATPGVYLLQLGSTERQLIVPGAANPDWSPDGTQLVVQSGAQIVRVDVATGTSSALSTNESFNAFPAWSPDGRYVAFSSNGGDSHSPPDLWLVSVDSPGSPHRVPLAGPPRNEILEKDWAPSNDKLVVSATGTPQRLFVTDTSGRDTAYISPSNVNARMPAWRPQGDWIVYVRTRPNEYGDLWLLRPDGWMTTSCCGWRPTRPGRRMASASPSPAPRRRRPGCGPYSLMGVRCNS